MDSANVEIARTVMDAFNARDVETFDRFVAEGFEWVTATASSAAPRTYLGRQGIREFFAQISNWRSVEARVEEWRDLGGHVLLLGDVLWRGHNPRLLEVSCPLVSLWSFADRRLTRIDSVMSEDAIAALSAG